MKKLISTLLALSMLFSLTLNVGAIGAGQSEVGEVKITVAPGQESIPDIYHVTVAWSGALTFQYTKGDVTKNWNTETHTYDDTTGEGKWDGETSRTLTVTNHSNVALDVAVTFEENKTSKEVNGVTASIANASFQLESGVDKTSATADKDVATLSVSGAPTTDNFTVGTVYVSIAKDA